MRSSIILLGSLLGRFQEGAVPHPGGCIIGKRPIDLHLEALKKMGAEISEVQGQIFEDYRTKRMSDTVSFC